MNMTVAAEINEAARLREKERPALDIDIWILGLLVFWGKGHRSFELWIGPMGVLFKIRAGLELRRYASVHIGADVGRGYLASTLFEMANGAEGWSQNLEILLGPFGYFLRFVQSLSLPRDHIMFNWAIRIGPDGMLFRHTLRYNKQTDKRFSLYWEESAGPFKSLASLVLDVEWINEGPARLEGALLVGPLGRIFRLEESSRRLEPGLWRLMLSGGLGPGGFLSRGMMGIDFSIRPVRPFFEWSIGPGRKLGFFYRHSGGDAWINGLDIAKKVDRSFRVVTFDMPAVEGGEARIMALVQEAVPGFLAPTVPHVKVNLFIDGQKIDRVRTDENGLALFVVPMVTEGSHRIGVCRGDQPPPEGSGTARLLVLPKDRPVIVLRLEGLIAGGWEQAFAKGDWSLLDIDVQALALLKSISEKYSLMYMTRLPAEYLASLRLNLFGDEQPMLPRGILIPTRVGPMLDRIWTLPFPEMQTGKEDVAERFIKNARYIGLPLLVGISHLPRDIQMMKNARLTICEVPISDNGDGEKEPLIAALQKLDGSTVFDNYRRQALDHVAFFRRAQQDPILAKQRIIAEMTGVDAVAPNRIEIYADAGDAVPEIFRAIDAADVAVCLSTMMLGTDNIGNRITTHLIDAANRGAKVRVMVDQWLSEHSETFPNANIQRLAESPVELLVRKLAHGFARVHKKTITTLRTDGDATRLVAFAGGMNWVEPSFGNFPDNLEDKELENPERDLFSKIEGPAANALMEDFLATWKWAKGNEIDEDEMRRLLPEPLPYQGKSSFDRAKIHVVGNIPGQDRKISHGLLALIHSARRRIRIEQNFPPSAIIIEALIDVMKRGVRVDWIFGARKGISALITDPMLLNKAAILFAAGAKINRRSNPMTVGIYPITVHMKAICIDSEVFYFGTANLDYLSVDQDAETMLIIPDADIARWFVHHVFEPDLRKCTRVRYDAADRRLIIGGNPESPLEKINRSVMDSLLPEQIQ